MALRTFNLDTAWSEADQSQAHTIITQDRRLANWTDERIARLKELWALGWSAGQIAKDLGGVTRSAVLGKVHRLELPNRKTTKPAVRVKKPRIRIRLNTPPKRRILEIVPEEEFIPVCEPISLMQLTDTTCRWPIGDGPYQFCGGPSVKGLPYCHGHCRVAYETPEMRRRGMAA